MGAHASRLRYDRQGNTSGKPLKYSGVLFRDHELQGRGKLEIVKDDIVFQQKSKTAIVWPIRSIRRYGCEKDTFSFESGRRCDTGPGFYTFQAKDASAIFTIVQETVLQIAGADDSSRIVDENSSRIVVEGSSRIVVPNSYSPPRPVSSRFDPPSKNHYLNCDGQGRALECDGRGLDRENTIPQSLAPQKPPNLEYADLDLAVLDGRRTSMDDPRWTPTRGLVSPHGLVSPLPVVKENSKSAKSKPVGVPVRNDPTSGTVYATIDPTKSIAAANLARSFS